MKIVKFEDIIAWQKAQELGVNIYSLLGKSNDFGFKNQICLVAISVSNNIAEGFDRSSDSDFSRFLYIALSSCSEVKSMIYLAEKLNYINKEKKYKVLSQCNETSKIIRGLIKSLAP